MPIVSGMTGLLKLVNEETFSPELQDIDLREGVRSVLELLGDRENYSDPPYQGGTLRVAWQDGYTTAMRDVIEALADEWGITYTQEQNDGGEEQ